jgi:hypothetical protein
MDYELYVRKLSLPGDFVPPGELTHDDFRAKAIRRHHLADDVRGINASLDLIRQTRGGTWPTGPVTEE